ncbi:MAG: hypothetical protein IKJ83_00835 [Ruminococcus sp.]|nr:hypothetical protein [Ruminococcus sp.]
MKYCPSCKSIVKEVLNQCPDCTGALENIEDTSTVTVANVKGSAISVLESALKSVGIPCRFEKTDGSIYNEYNAKVSAESDFKVLVPFEMYNKAFDVCEGFGFVSPEDRLIPEEESEGEEETKTYNEKFESATGVKHHTWQMMGIVIFIVLACLVIWGVDFIAAWIKGMIV